MNKRIEEYLKNKLENHGFGESVNADDVIFISDIIQKSIDANSRSVHMGITATCGKLANDYIDMRLDGKKLFSTVSFFGNPSKNYGEFEFFIRPDIFDEIKKLQ